MSTHSPSVEVLVRRQCRVYRQFLIVYGTRKPNKRGRNSRLSLLFRQDSSSEAIEKQLF